MKTKFILFFLLLFFLVPGPQSLPLLYADIPVEVRAIVVPSKAHLGDEIRLKILVNRPKLFTVEPLPEDMNLAPFEVKFVEHDSISKRGRVYETFTVTLTLFELGDHLIKPIGIRVKDDQGMGYDIPTQQLQVKVISVGRKPTDSDDIRPIKGPASSDLSKWFALLIGAAILVLAWLLAFLIWRRFHGMIKDPEALKPPNERALLELGRLKNKDYLAQDRLREYATELCDILRRYVSRRYRVDALEMTTAELMPEIKKTDFDFALLPVLVSFFESADLAKFAKVVLPKERLVSMEEELQTIVKATQEKTEKK